MKKIEILLNEKELYIFYKRTFKYIYDRDIAKDLARLDMNRAKRTIEINDEYFIFDEIKKVEFEKLIALDIDSDLIILEFLDGTSEIIPLRVFETEEEAKAFIKDFSLISKKGKQTVENFQIEESFIIKKIINKREYKKLEDEKIIYKEGIRKNICINFLINFLILFIIIILFIIFKIKSYIGENVKYLFSIIILISIYEILSLIIKRKIRFKKEEKNNDENYNLYEVIFDNDKVISSFNDKKNLYYYKDIEDLLYWKKYFILKFNNEKGIKYLKIKNFTNYNFIEKNILKKIKSFVDLNKSKKFNRRFSMFYNFLIFIIIITLLVSMNIIFVIKIMAPNYYNQLNFMKNRKILINEAMFVTNGNINNTKIYVVTAYSGQIFEIIEKNGQVLIFQKTTEGNLNYKYKPANGDILKGLSVSPKGSSPIAIIVNNKNQFITTILPNNITNEEIGQVNNNLITIDNFLKSAKSFYLI